MFYKLILYADTTAVLIFGPDFFAQKLNFMRQGLFYSPQLLRFIDFFPMPFAAFEHESTHACVGHLA